VKSNTLKTEFKTLTKQSLAGNKSSVFLGEEELELVAQFKYLGVILDSNLTFKKHIQTNTIQFNLQNFKQIRSYIATDAAKSYLHCMIFSHIEYCFTVWSFAGVTALKPINQLYKKAVKVFDRKPQSFHLCPILEKYQLLNFENLNIFKNSCLIYKSMNGIAPPPLGDFIKKKNSETRTRSFTRGDCEVPFRKSSFAQNVLSIKGCTHWNSLPKEIRDSPTFASFKKQLKRWLNKHQKCNHLV